MLFHFLFPYYLLDINLVLSSSSFYLIFQTKKIFLLHAFLSLVTVWSYLSHSRVQLILLRNGLYINLYVENLATCDFVY
jgi:hypothetical protein